MNNELAWDKSILTVGDSQQTLPVMEYAIKASLLASCIKASPLWSLFTSIKLEKELSLPARRISGVAGHRRQRHSAAHRGLPDVRRRWAHRDPLRVQLRLY